MSTGKKRVKGADLVQIRGLKIDGLSNDVWHPIVKGVDLTLRRGEVLGLIGESGAGKSTLGLAAMGFARPGCRISAGSIVFDGIDLIKATTEEKRALHGSRIAYVAQSAAAAFNPAHRLIDQTVETAVGHGIMSRDRAEADARDLFKRLQLPNPDTIGQRFPHQVSGGQLQRAMTAMAMSCRPDLIIFDEPTTALDVTTQAQILELLGGIARDRGTAVVLITHDLGIVAGFCDRVEVMYAGRVVEGAAAEEIYERPLHPYTWGLLGSVARLDRARTGRLRAIRGAPPSPLTVHAGCAFHARCDFANDLSGCEVPLLRPIAAGHHAACHRAGELELSAREHGP